ncbi:MAG: c-type cytochrome [Actinomycetes bacterium]
MHKIKVGRRIGVVAVLAIAVAFAAPAAFAQSKANAGDPVKGKVIFQTYFCYACHSLRDAASHGQVGPDLDRVKPRATYAVVIASVTNGLPETPVYPTNMVAWNNVLTASQIQDVAAYVVSVAGKKVVKTTT